MQIYLLRHGETAYNAEKRYQGTRDIPLSDKGRQELAPADITPEVVYCSPLCRATETAAILFPAARLALVQDLREMCHGIFEGRNYVEMEQDAEYRAWVEADCLGRCPGGESKDEFCNRSCAAFARLVEEALAREQTMLVVMAHGGTQMALMERFGLPRREYYHWCSPNASGYLLETSREQWQTHRTMTLVETVQYRKEEVLCSF